MSRGFTNLMNNGWTNYGSEDYGVIASASMRCEVNAWCGSDKCRKAAGSHKMIRKYHISKSSTYCPDCNRTLIWKPVKGEL